MSRGPLSHPEPVIWYQDKSCVLVVKSLQLWSTCDGGYSLLLTLDWFFGRGRTTTIAFHTQGHHTTRNVLVLLLKFATCLQVKPHLGRTCFPTIINFLLNSQRRNTYSRLHLATFAKVTVTVLVLHPATYAKMFVHCLTTTTVSTRVQFNSHQLQFDHLLMQKCKW